LSDRPLTGDPRLGTGSDMAAIKPQRVVVGVDGSEGSIDALKWAVTYARNVGGSLTAVKTWHYPWAMQTAPAQVDTKVSDQTLQELDEAFTKSGVDVSGVDVQRQALEGHPALVLAKESATADLVVVGSTGHSAFAGMLLGSVSQHLAHSASCPVVIVRSKSD
jgi:nucleotide-binding universal stress UspA family protein